MARRRASSTNPIPPSGSFAASARAFVSTRVGAFAVLALLVIAMFGDVLIAPDTLLSQTGTDMSLQFVSWRAFGFDELRHGRLAFWTPHIFAGMPFLGGFQSALFYPPNLLHLVLSPAPAINAVIALHVFLAGAFMYMWAAGRGLHPIAALTSGCLFMFGQTLFLCVFAGHLSALCTIAWAPLVMRVVDELFGERWLRYTLVGALVVAMQLFAGHPQFALYIAVAACLYAAPRLMRSEKRWQALGGLAMVYAGGALLAAVQLAPGFDAAAESIRSVRVPYEFASMLSFPPENVLTALAPGIFGDRVRFPYWGRGYLWESTVFMGAGGLLLAAYGAVRGDRTIRRDALFAGAALFLLALGSHTPLFQIVYRLPVFGQLRGSAKFATPMVMCLVLVAGAGLHAFLVRPGARPRVAVWMTAAAIVIAAAGGAFAMTSRTFTPPWWTTFVAFIEQTRESYLPADAYASVDFVNAALSFASGALLVVGVTTAVFAGLVWCFRFGRWPAYAIAALAMVEVATYARLSRPTFPLADLVPAGLERFSRDHPGDYRVLNLDNPNLSMFMNTRDIWGLDPGVSKRYAEFMAMSQGLDPDHATQAMSVESGHPLFRMLRLKYVFQPTRSGGLGVAEEPNPMPRAALIYDWQLATSRDGIFDAMLRPDFDPAQRVILESVPDYVPERPASDESAAVRVVDETTDRVRVEATLTRPAILLFTDGYSAGWKATPAGTSAQSTYTVLPADYVLMAIPLSAGHHNFTLDYVPPSYRTGAMLSLASAFAWIGAWMLVGRRRTAGR
jgi:hypothetical protein